VLALLVVLVAAAALRFASAFTIGDVTALHGDEGYYLRGARSLAAGRGYPGALRPPGYPAFVAVALALGGGSLRVARVAQIVVALIGIAALFELVRVRFGSRAAFLSAGLYALHPTLVFYSHLFWSETLVVTLLLLAFLCLERFDRDRRPAWLAAAGVTLGAAVLTRDMLLFFVPVIVAWLWLDPERVGPGRLRRALLVLVPMAVVIAPWMARNHAAQGRLFVLSTNSWFPVAVGNLIPRDRLLGMADENREFNRAYYATPGGEAGRDAFARESALRAIAERQPGWIVRKLVRNTYYLLSTASQLKRFVKEDWLAPGWREVGRRLATVEAAFYVLQMVLGIGALWLVPGGRVKLLVIALILFHWAVYVVANATHRFRVPLLPFFLLYTGPLLVGDGWRGRVARWRIGGAAAGLAVFAAVVVTPYVRRLFLALLLPVLLLGCTSPAEMPRPNVVLISIDTLRPDHLGAYGYARATSPSIDALAAGGVLFENALSPSSWTLPAHASLLSGVSPYRHGAVAATARIRDDVPLLAELLRAHGYHTAAFVNAPFVSRTYGFARGFERFEQRFERKRRDTAERHQQVLDGVAALEPPFFLFVHYMDVHSPFRPPREFNRFAKDRHSVAVLKDLGQGSIFTLQRGIRAGRLEISAEAVQRFEDLYDDEILAMDAKIGELVTVLRARFQNAIVILTSDHGEEFLEHGSIGHGDTLYEEVLRVPLIVAGPGVVQGARAPELVSLLDIVPTVLEWLGAPRPAGLEGRSLAPMLAERAGNARRDVMLALHTGAHDGSVALRGMRDEARKLIRDDYAKRTEFYDLASDPAECHSLAPQATDAKLEQALARLGVPETVAAPKPDAETVESLKALGYL